jgi:hypothetical protein
VSNLGFDFEIALRVSLKLIDLVRHRLLEWEGIPSYLGSSLP